MRQRANRKQCHYDYAPGQQVLKKVHNPTKLGVRTTGPYNIEQVHVNGTLTIELRRGVNETSTYTMSSCIVNEHGCIRMHEPISASPGEDKGHHLVSERFSSFPLVSFCWNESILIFSLHHFFVYGWATRLQIPAEFRRNYALRRNIFNFWQFPDYCVWQITVIRAK
jgi:hypothetical protein